MFTSKEDFLALKITIMQSLDHHSSFLEWARSSEYRDIIEEILLRLEESLEDLDGEYCAKSTPPSTEYQIALDDLENYPEKLENFLNTYSIIDKNLFPHIGYLKEINNEFHSYFTRRLLRLHTMLMQSTIHDSDFGDWISQSDFSSDIKNLSSILISLFSKLDEPYKESEYRPLYLKFTDALAVDDEHKFNSLCSFLKKYPSITLLLSKNIKLLEKTNASFLKHLHSQNSYFNCSKLIEKLNDFFIEDASPYNLVPDILETKKLYFIAMAKIKESNGNLESITDNLKNLSNSLKFVICPSFEMHKRLRTQIADIQKIIHGLEEKKTPSQKNLYERQ